MFLKTIAKTIVALNANIKPSQISAGAAFGVMLALIPGPNLFWVLLLLLTFFLKINQGIELILMALLAALVPVFDGFIHQIGFAIISFEPVHGLFAFLYNSPVFPFLKLNNTLVMGGFALGLILWVPVFLLFNMLVNFYRKQIRDRIITGKFVDRLKKLPLIGKLIELVEKFSVLAQ
ncbi:MAG: TIGR03546 family protein [Spirochaetales bacterium]|nr:TIGR03546 family protein [Spirochaetales bacterium]